MEAFAVLQYQKDFRHKRITSQILLIEQELAELTFMELEQRSAKLDEQMVGTIFSFGQINCLNWGTEPLLLGTLGLASTTLSWSTKQLQTTSLTPSLIITLLLTGQQWSMFETSWCAGSRSKVVPFFKHSFLYQAICTQRTPKGPE